MAEGDTLFVQEDELPDLPLDFIKPDSCLIPHWEIGNDEETVLHKMQLTNEQVMQIDRETVAQSSSEQWFQLRKGRITSSNAHKVFVRKKDFQSLIETFTGENVKKKFPKSVEDALKHGKTFEPIATELYVDVMKHKLNRHVFIRETGIVIQPNLYWLAASPDGLVKDSNNNPNIGLLEIKCPKSKRNSTPQELLGDQSFYIGIYDGQPYLKKTHGNGYCTQIQMAMGLAHATFCDFIVYTFQGMVIIRALFHENYFHEVVTKLNVF